jgi:hypothetical protein
MSPVKEAGAYTTHFLKELPPAVQQEGNSVVLNFPLTIPESMFLAFVKGMVQYNLDKKYDLIYLGTSEKMQSDFSGWVAKTFTSKQFTSEELKLATVVPSLWMKTKTFVENELKKNQNPDQASIANEKQWQVEADNLTEEFRLQGRIGKVFTIRQAKFLITAANNIGK